MSQEAMQPLGTRMGWYALEYHLGYARDAAKPNDGTVYQILAKEGNQTKVRGIWYPATTYQDMGTGRIYTRITTEFEAKFREFDSYEDAFTWARDF